MATPQIDLRADLLDWRKRLENVIDDFEDSAHLAPLLSEVDLALQRIENGSNGICESCQEVIEDEAMKDPIARFCLECLNKEQQRALESDIENVSRVQHSLLPKQDLAVEGWHAYYHYEAAGPVGGDYCDLVSNGNGDLFFMVGDVSGKGIAASMLMAHLHAIFRSLIMLDLSVDQLVERANHIFSDATMPAYYATLVCGRARRSGEIEICNAGHCPPLLIRSNEVVSIEATGLPVGMFCREQYSAVRVQLDPQDSVLLYTDGVTESRDLLNSEYGTERLNRLAASGHALMPQALTSACLDDLYLFRSGQPKTDDLTVMVIQRAFF
ncbi:MAG TPA: PP2C family protein-serine/threonine phosphatase [Blastocatellia bacterium]|nr:PP2C family protein-serine/threonine phosphatase [Blastocatellia bacterium]